MAVNILYRNAANGPNPGTTNLVNTTNFNLIFDYQSPTNFKFAGVFVGNQPWVLGQRTGAGWQIQAFANDPSITPGTPYNLRLLFASAFTGSLGLATENSISQFNDVIVQ